MLTERLEEVTPTLAQIGRATLAATIAYVAALVLTTTTVPLLASLTALLVVQTTRYQTLVHGLLRVLSVVAGVLIALLFSSVLGFTWWTLALIVGSSLVLGQLLRLGPHAIEVPISAMLVLSVGAAETAIDARVAETLIGAFTGVVVNMALGPGVQLQSAGVALEDLADRLAGLLSRVADEIATPSHEQARRWLEDARALSTLVVEVDESLDETEDSLRLNPRGPRSPEAAASLRASLEALEHCTVSVRGLCRSLAERVQQEPDGAPVWDQDSARVLARLLHSLADLVRSYGDVVRSEPLSRSPFAESRLFEVAERARSALAAVPAELSVDATQQPGVWALHGAVLTHAERVLAELEPAARRRAREEWTHRPGRRTTSRRALDALRRGHGMDAIRQRRRRWRRT